MADGVSRPLLLPTWGELIKLKNDEEMQVIQLVRGSMINGDSKVVMALIEAATPADGRPDWKCTDVRRKLFLIYGHRYTGEELESQLCAELERIYLLASARLILIETRQHRGKHDSFSQTCHMDMLTLQERARSLREEYVRKQLIVELAKNYYTGKSSRLTRAAPSSPSLVEAPAPATITLARPPPRPTPRPMMPRPIIPLAQPLTHPVLRPVLSPALRPVLSPALRPVLSPALRPVLRPALHPAPTTTLRPIIPIPKPPTH